MNLHHNCGGLGSSKLSARWVEISNWVLMMRVIFIFDSLQIDDRFLSNLRLIIISDEEKCWRRKVLSERRNLFIFWKGKMRAVEWLAPRRDKFTMVTKDESRPSNFVFFRFERAYLLFCAAERAEGNVWREFLREKLFERENFSFRRIQSRVNLSREREEHWRVGRKLMQKEVCTYGGVECFVADTSAVSGEKFSSSVLWSRLNYVQGPCHLIRLPLAGSLYSLFKIFWIRHIMSPLDTVELLKRPGGVIYDAISSFEVYCSNFSSDIQNFHK